MKRTAIAVMMVTVASVALSPAAGDDRKASVLLQAAKAKEAIEGDLKGAIALYQQAADEAGANRSLAARALLGSGQAYQKLGGAEADAVFARIVRDFTDQKDVVAAARAGLAALKAERQQSALISPPITVTLSPNPVTATDCSPVPCGGVRGLFRFRADGTLTIHETAGIGGNVNSITAMHRIPVALSADEIVQRSGTNHVAAHGMLSVPLFVFTAPVNFPNAPRQAVFSYEVQFTDDRGTQLTATAQWSVK